MTGELHEVSLAIGALQADVKNLMETQRSTGVKIDEIHASVPALVSRVDGLEPTVRRLDRRSAFDRGVAAAVGVVLGSLGSAIIQFFLPPPSN